MARSLAGKDSECDFLHWGHRRADILYSAFCTIHPAMAFNAPVGSSRYQCNWVIQQRRSDRPFIMDETVGATKGTVTAQALYNIIKKMRSKSRILVTIYETEYKILSSKMNPNRKLNNIMKSVRELITNSRLMVDVIPHNYPTKRGKRWRET